jgi:NAD(P)-dependent dehydrogenase (short-subunit alcohol dehydrogenase family)
MATVGKDLLAELKTEQYPQPEFMDQTAATPDEGVNATNQELENPVDKYPKEFAAREQQLPGSEQAMSPTPDHGETSYKGTGKLNGRRAIITGGDSGIGKAVAIAFAREGADVLISYLNEEEDARDTATYIEKEGKKAVLVPGDISNEAQCKQIVEKALQELGGIDIIVNNAATQVTHESLQDIPSEEWDQTFRTNIHAMFYLCKAAEPHLKPGASVINTTSVNAYTPKPVLIPYTTTKGAIQNFTSSLAQLWGEKGIRVNCVAPGPIWTPLIPASFTGDEISQFGSNTPMKRAGQPAELAPVYVLLASQESSYVSGATVPVTGGMPTI